MDRSREIEKPSNPIKGKARMMTRETGLGTNQPRTFVERIARLDWRTGPTPEADTSAQHALKQEELEFVLQYNNHTSKISPEDLQGLKDLRKRNPEWFDKLESLTPTDDASRHRMQGNAELTKAYQHLKSTETNDVDIELQKLLKLRKLQKNNPALFDKIQALDGIGPNNVKFVQDYIHLKSKIPPEVSQELEALRSKKPQLFDRINSDFFDLSRADQLDSAEKIKDTGDSTDAFQRKVDQWRLEEIDIERIQRATFARDFSVTSVLDFKQLAKDFQHALIEGSPEEIFHVLYFLQREQKAINKLNEVYLDEYDQPLESAINDHLCNSQDPNPRDNARREYARQLINKGKSEAEQFIAPGPPTEREYGSVIERIYQALHPRVGEPKPENVYAILTSFERNTGLLCELNGWYNDTFETDLKTDIENSLEKDPKAKDYALFLLGDQAMEKKEISEYEAMRLSAAIFPGDRPDRCGHTFDRGDGMRIPVPYDHPLGGCQDRAHIMAQALKEMGYASEKIYTQSMRLDEDGQKKTDLHVRTNLAHDGHQIVEWDYHVAPCVWIKPKSGNKELFVLDPSLSTRPLTPKNWMSKMGKASYALITFDEYQAKLTEEYHKNPRAEDLSPAGQTYVFTASRNWYGLPGLDHIEEALDYTAVPDQYALIKYNHEGKKHIIDNAKWVPYNRMARSIRQELQNPTINNAEDARGFLRTIATNFLADRREYRFDTSSDWRTILLKFRSNFPNLYKDWIDIAIRVGYQSDNSSS